ncbi:galactokinase [Nakamurella flava]|uniref:Galactokinase n=1 Tax=Nakamurella flava TaxID=2576308 RepID=A0A4U6QD10_9ACTN|nr:galactokinase [Nakamurella flava]TKV57826.1 galactokinase [Nakamurella flava]
MSPADIDVRALFRASFDREPDGVFSAPGRVNLIGEHTDYSGGLVLPFAIDARAVIAAAGTDDGLVSMVSAQRPGAVVTVPLAGLAPGAVDGWAAYVAGSVWAAREAGVAVSGLALALDSTVPSGAGLSSSAALECAVVLAVAGLAGQSLEPLEVARIAQRAENAFVGVPCGPMDQTASAASEAGSVLLFDTRAGTIDHIPFDPGAAGLSVLVVDTRVSHSLADGEYGRRRASCERAVDILGVEQLRDLRLDDLAGTLAALPDDELRRRVRHVVTENARVVQVVELLRASRIDEIGDLLTASHVSLRDDYDVSCAELDVAVEVALAAGALGARMTGGGFGGSIIALVPTASAAGVGDAVIAAFAERGWTAPVVRPVSPAAGARRD